MIWSDDVQRASTWNIHEFKYFSHETLQHTLFQPNAFHVMGIRIFFFLFFLFKFFKICSKEIEINLHSHSLTAACMGQFSKLNIAPAIYFLYILPPSVWWSFSFILTSTSSLNTWTADMAVVCVIALCSCNLLFVLLFELRGYLERDSRQASV